MLFQYHIALFMHAVVKIQKREREKERERDLHIYHLYQIKVSLCVIKCYFVIPLKTVCLKTRNLDLLNFKGFPIRKSITSSEANITCSDVGSVP